MASSVGALASRALEEIRQVFSSADESKLESPLKAIVEEITQARQSQIAVYGVGREGLMLKALAMRLFHLGLLARCVGDMNSPRLGPGDLLIASAGPGTFSTVDALISAAAAAGARVLLLTAQPSGPATRLATRVAVLPAQTMADDVADGDVAPPLLPMGSAYEGALFVLSELAVLQLRDILGESPAAMRARHTNLE